MLKQHIENYTSSREAIFETFDGTDHNCEGIAIYPSTRYCKLDDSLNYGWVADNDDYDYNFEIARSQGVKEGWELFYVSENGEDFYALFQVEFRDN